jgi:hypothetical protein
MHTFPRLARRLFHLFLLVSAVSVVSVPGDTARAAAELTVSPTAVAFANTAVGTQCPGANCSYAMVTITNTGNQIERLVSAKGNPTPPFWPTYGGTCNVKYLYLLPPKESCTFQWGFKPQNPGKFTGTGTISFESGATVNVALSGVGTGGGRGRGRGRG